MKSRGVYTVGKNMLIPQDERAHEIQAKLKPGDRVLIAVHKARNPEHNRLAHLVFQLIADAKGLPLEVVKVWLKWQTGRIDLVALPDGRHIAVPRSLSFENMSQEEFQKFWTDALPVIAEQILPQMPEETFQEIRDIIAGKL